MILVVTKARTSSVQFLSQTDDERVALRAPQYKGTGSQEPFLQRGAFLMWYAGIDWAKLQAYVSLFTASLCLSVGSIYLFLFK
jgi:hypothetical protein